ncbi:MAG: NifB/NifX family molybdenum-iron cluster-binding protein [Candidatus Coatesbacteria bacterium]|nr:NifB/NifX family molybdenum-iron cluster-binding protein [Candidatus Coatesbacteria bacterium]
MKVAVSSEGKTLDSKMDERFARAPFFIFADTKTGEFEVHDNDETMNAAHGAGVQASRLMAERGVEVVITGHCGPNAFRALNAAGIEVVTGASGTVSEVLAKFKSGEIKPASNPDVKGHW